MPETVLTTLCMRCIAICKPRHKENAMENGICPLCRSHNIAAHFNLLYIITGIVLFPFGLVLLLLPRNARCRNCGHRFKSSGMSIA